jgi:DNA ligase (NAD+)
MKKWYDLSDIDLEKISPSQLGEILIEAKKTYYTTSSPIMSDHTYDTLEKILKKLSPHHRLFKKVGHQNFKTGFEKKKHVIPMGSQNKVKTLPELKKYFDRHHLSSFSFIVQPKCDGISLELIYQQGKIQDAITRGDGITGDLITQNVSKMQGFLPTLPQSFTGSARFETMITFADFKKLKKAAPNENYSNPRNSVAGISQRLDGKFSRFCTIFYIDLDHRDNKQDLPTEMDRYRLAQKLGFKTIETYLCPNYQEVENRYQDFLHHQRDTYPFEIDGIVVKINDIKLQKSLGSINGRPKGQVAYKFPNLSKETSIQAVTWQVGPLGTLTPVAQVDPINIGGSIVTFASLANFDLIKQKNINLSDIVTISRRGDVIPYIEKVLIKVKKGHLSAPQNCPSCQTKLKKVHKYLKCPNSQCPDQILGRLDLFCKKLAIDGISTETIKKLYQTKKIRLPGDFYTLKVDDFLDLEGLGQKSGQNILDQIQAKKQLSPQELLFSISIPHLSQARLKQLKRAGYQTVESILGLDQKTLASLPGFKETLSQKIIAGIQDRKKEIDSVLKHVTLKSSSSSQKLSGLTFCITGKLKRPRSQIIKDIEDRGGQVLSAVSKNLDYLVTNNPHSSSSKNKEAKKLKIKTITEKDLKKLLR